MVHQNTRVSGYSRNFALQFDLDVIRAILLQVEKGPAEGGWAELSIPGHDDQSISGCVQQLHDAGYIEALELWTFTGDVWKPIRLTWKAQALIDALHNDPIWDKAKAIVLANSAEQDLNATLEGLKVALLSLTENPSDEA